jgi:hypothetical protein
MTPRPEITDAHIITATMICEQAQLNRRTFNSHLTKGHIEPGAIRLGKAFWTLAQANKYIRKIGKRDLQFK